MAAVACRNLSNGSSSTPAAILPAWQLLLAHTLHAAGSVLAAIHTDGLLPRVRQQQQQQADDTAPVGADRNAVDMLLPCHPNANRVLGSVSSALAALGPQLIAMQGHISSPAAAAVQGFSSNNAGAWSSLLQQQDDLSRCFGQLLAAAEGGSSGSSSSSSGNWEEQLAPFRDEYSWESLKMLVSLRSAVSSELAQRLVDFAAALSGRFPAKLCCNAPGCSSLAKFSELEAVGGKACMFGRCKTARCGGMSG
jgi:hypothetical protein